MHWSCPPIRYIYRPKTKKNLQLKVLKVSALQSTPRLLSIFRANQHQLVFVDEKQNQLGFNNLGCLS